MSAYLLGVMPIYGQMWAGLKDHPQMTGCVEVDVPNLRVTQYCLSVIKTCRLVLHCHRVHQHHWPPTDSNLTRQD